MKTKRKLSSDKPNTGTTVTKKMNPFEIHINRSKHQVLGRKLKSDQGLPGISKNKAIQKRNKTLLQEYRMKGKNNNFIDQRIGERNSNMTEDDKIMARFTAERMRMFNKKTMFNLSDSEVLTHRGQTLSEIEKFEDIKSDDEEEEVGSSGALKRKFVEEAHFGGGMLTKNSKDRESLIDELINESKKRKAERQRNKEETLEATEQLDEDWKTLGLIVTAPPKDTDELANSQKNDKYDVFMRQLKFEPQGQASQRLKTDEEVAKEDKEQLEKLEKERLRQLREIEADKYKNHRSADDLDDGFSYSVDGFEDKTLEKSEDESSESSEEENEGENDKADNEGETDDESDTSEKNQDSEEESEDETSQDKEESDNYKEANKQKVFSEANTEEELMSENEEDELSADSDEASSDEECAMDDLGDLMPSIVDQADSTSSRKLQPQEQESSKDSEEETVREAQPVVELDLPYVLPVPESFDDFKETIGKYAPQQLNIILERIVKSNHPNLHPENKNKMLNLAEYIIQLVAEGELCWGAVPVLVTHFVHIKSFNREACLNLLLQSVPSAELSTPVMKCVVWYCLVFLKPEGMEMLLPVSRPVSALTCHIMSQADLLSPTHLLTALLCTYLLLQDAKTSSTLFLEPIKFLHNCIKSFSEESSSSPRKSKEVSKSLVNAQESVSKGCIPEKVRILLTDLDNPKLKLSEIRQQVLHYALVLSSAFIKVYRKYPQSKILFKPLQSTVNQIKMERYSEQIKEEVVKLKELLQVLQSAQLPSLVKEAKKPKALRQYEPAIHAVTTGKWNYGLPADKREEQKLIHKYKQEMKGAMRELRRDGAFIANLKLKERIYSDEQRVKKVKEIFGSAAEQQGELRKLKRKK